ncbi:MAG: hypothetical protein PHX62_00430 [Bacilli bacterium]|nr:hypothetical protein [Bacilli bacterium]
MINLDDYKAYLLENKIFLDALKDHHSLIYERLEDVFSVMEYIENQVEKHERVEEEYEIVFEFGFSYLHGQIEEIKNLFNLYFKKDFLGFKKYDALINYHLYLCDLEETLKGLSLYSEQAKTAIFNIYEEIETILSEKKEIDYEILTKFNQTLEEFVSTGTFSNQELFAMMKEEIDMEN